MGELIYLLFTRQ